MFDHDSAVSLKNVDDCEDLAFQVTEVFDYILFRVTQIFITF
jgi:hypothetical protein